MKRRHLFEVMDQSWCPDKVRRLATDFMGTFLPKMKVHAPALPELVRALRETGSTTIVDLCAGMGGPLLAYKRQLEADVGSPLTVTLTDIFPNRGVQADIAARGDDSIRYVAEPVDALRVPNELRGFRTLFEAFHHFQPDQARRILQDAVDREEGIAVIEITERSVLGLLFFLVVSPLSVYALTPFAKPFTWWRLALTYAVPVAPILSIWESAVSCLRTYTEEELREMTASLSGRPYQWVFGRTFDKGPVCWMIGTPVVKAA